MVFKARKEYLVSPVTYLRFKSSACRMSFSCKTKCNVDLHRVLQSRPSTQTVYQRDLVSEHSRSKDIVKEHQVYCDIEKEAKHFKGNTLAFLTPVRKLYFVLMIYLLFVLEFCALLILLCLFTHVGSLPACCYL